MKKIEANHGLLGTGFLGTPYLLEELTKTGHTKLAYNLLLNTEYPSWGYLVEHGATTTWERWNGDQMKDDPQHEFVSTTMRMARWRTGFIAMPREWMHRRWMRGSIRWCCIRYLMRVCRR